MPIHSEQICVHENGCSLYTKIIAHKLQLMYTYNAVTNIASYDVIVLFSLIVTMNI